MYSTWHSELCRRTFTSKGGIRSHATRGHGAELSFHITSETSLAHDNHYHSYFNNDEDDFSPTPPHIIRYTYRIITEEVFRFYMDSMEAVQILHPKLVATPSLSTIPDFTQISILYVTLSAISAADSVRSWPLLRAPGIERLCDCVRTAHLCRFRCCISTVLG